MSIILPCRPRHLLSPLAFALLIACSSAPEEKLPIFEQQQAALVRAENCTDLLQRIQADQIAKLNHYADDYLAQYRQFLKGELPVAGTSGVAGAIGEPSIGQDSGSIPSFGSAGTSGSTTNETGGSAGTSGESSGSTTGGTGGTASTSGSGGSASAGNSSGAVPDTDPSAPNTGNYTGTNTQVKSVDEADIIKTDGHRIFAVRGSSFYEIDADPVAQFGETNRVMIEGFASEIFIHENHAIVYSAISSGASPFPTLNNSQTQNDYYSCGPSITKITVFDISTAGAPKEVISRYFEGDYLSSRRSDDIVRTVIRSNIGSQNYNPSIEMSDIFGNPLSEEDIKSQLDTWRKTNEQAILKTTLSDWLPRTGTSINGQFSLDSDQCENYYSPNSGSVSSGLNTLVTINLKTANSSWDRLNILGYAGQLYASDNTFLLAQEHYSGFNYSNGEETAVHQFSLDNTTGSTHYDASGKLPGHLPSQLGLHEKDGVIFAAASHFQDSSTNIYSLKQSKNELKVLSETPSIAPGERVTAVRFIGDKAYVVTYLFTDPLFVVDLKDPQDLKILGELKIPGFSEYVHPLADGQLLTVGRADDVGDESAIQIFDVSDPTQPTLVQKLVLADSQSLPVASDYRAFNFDDERSLLLLPIQSYYNPGTDRLGLFKIDAKTGIASLGQVTHQNNESCYGAVDNLCSSPIKRGFFIDDHIIAMSQRLISSSPLSTPNEISTAAALFGDDPDYNYYAYGCYDTPGWAIETPGIGGTGGWFTDAGIAGDTFGIGGWTGGGGATGAGAASSGVGGASTAGIGGASTAGIGGASTAGISSSGVGGAAGSN